MTEKKLLDDSGFVVTTRRFVVGQTVYDLHGGMRAWVFNHPLFGIIPIPPYQLMVSDDSGTFFEMQVEKKLAYRVAEAINRAVTNLTQERLASLRSEFDGMPEVD